MIPSLLKNAGSVFEKNPIYEAKKKRPFGRKAGFGEGTPQQDSAV